MSRGLDLAKTSRNFVTSDTNATDRVQMEPLMMHSIATTNEDIVAPANLNTMMIGPITIPAGKNLTIGSGGTLVII